MSTRVTSDEVKALLDGLADKSDVTLYIEQAALIVDEELSSSGLSEQRLRMIELNLAAHFAVNAIERGGLTKRRMNDTEEQYKANNGTRFSSTRFGQQAVILDNSSTLAQLDSPGGSAQFRVL